MRTINDKLNSLTENSVWSFAKQDVDFVNAFKAVKIFKMIPSSTVNVEDFFNNHSLDDGFKVNHRMLSSSQMFGLLTKTSNRYNEEKPTEVFEKLCQYEINSPEFNVLRTEQILKFRLGAIIDRTTTYEDYAIFPVFYIFDVLWKLHEKGIDEITEGQFYTYVLTCKTHEELDETVEFLSNNPTESQFVGNFKNLSRFLRLLTANCNLLLNINGKVSLNKKHRDLFHDVFYVGDNNVVLNLLNSIIQDEDVYKQILTTEQRFNINLYGDEPFTAKHILVKSIDEIKKSFPKDFTPIQKIFFGTPGSGKSHKITEETKSSKVFRTTFHPDYDFSTFVGCYKPAKENDGITYSFVPQCFTNAYIYAWKNPDKKVFLIIEEINRGNCAQIFGDVFQLLDRNKDGFSDYPIQPNKDLSNYLDDELVGLFDGNLNLPPNFNILASMNTSDQSLFPMDSAFKRRWDWEYVPIDYQNETSKTFTINLSDTKYSWTEFLQSVNAKIFAATDSEDKQMGNFFIKKDVDTKEFISKVMFYLWAEICKDEYGTDSKRNFFRDADNDDKEFSFNELSGNNEKLLKGFFKYIEKESKRD